MLLGSASGRADSATDQDPAKAADAKKAFSAGVAFLQDPDGPRYEEALAQFHRVRELIGTWKVLGNIGICAMKLERDGEAIEAFEKYLKESGGKLDRDEKAQVERDLATLRASVVNVHLVFASKGRLNDERTNNRGSRIINDYEITGSTLDVGMHPGRHTMVARLPSSESKWEVDLSPGARIDHTFGDTSPAIAPTSAPAPSGSAVVLPATVPQSVGPEASRQAAPPPVTEAPKSPPSRPIPTTVWISGGATLALAVGAVATGVATLSKRSDFNDLNGAPGRQADAQSAHDSAYSLALANTVLSGAALVGAGLTTYLYLSRPEAPGSRVGRPMILPWAAPTGGGITVRSDL